jgi:hypothetical protein
MNRSIKVWGLTAGTPHFSLEGTGAHERGTFIFMDINVYLYVLIQMGTYIYTYVFMYIYIYIYA